MRFLPLPVSVVPIVTVVTLVLVIWLGIASMRTPETLWAPGHLSRYHADIAQCTQCHQPFRGPTAARCAACHSTEKFAATASQETAEFHRKAIHQGQSCRSCHTEHRGALAQITIGTRRNPHGEFVFLATGTHSCRDCHGFDGGLAGRPKLLDNDVVRDLIREGLGAHRPGRFANCVQCHVNGAGDFEDEADDD